MPNSTNMNLPIPVVGTTEAPDWATLTVSCFNLIDAHDHTTGNGVPITSGAININADLSFNDVYNLTGLRTTRFKTQGAPLSGGTDIGCIYVVNADMYYNDTAGNQVRITQGGGVAGSPGSITNLAAPASASWVSATSKFVWQADASTSADMDFGSWIARNDTASSFALTVQPPTLAGNSTITLPLAPSGSTKIMAMSTSGVITAPYTVDGSTITIAANIIGVPTGGITTTQIASATILTGNIAASTILGANIAATTIAASNIVNGTLTGTQMASDINLPGSNVEAGSLKVITSSTNASTGLKVIRGYVTSNGTVITAGEGFSTSRTGTGTYPITFTSAFASTPVITGMVFGAFGYFTLTALSASGCTIQLGNTSAVNADGSFHFVAIGPR